MNYDKLLPSGILFNLKQLEEMSLIKISTAKKIIQQGGIATVRIGTKIHISRTELIRFLELNTVNVGVHDE